MAGTFTHWMVVDEVLNRHSGSFAGEAYFPTVSNLSPFVYLGAVGPDYPYLSELLSGYIKVHSWADRMHYENTGTFVSEGIKNLPRSNANAFNVCMAWLCGFASHLVVDSVVHPVVLATVGPYIFNSTEHRHCELSQDSYIFREIKHLEIRHSGYAAFLKMCSDPYDDDKIHPYLRDYWIKTLRAAHPGAEKHFDDIDPDTWHENFMSRVAFAENPIPIFRHFAVENNLAYRNTDELTDEERRRFIDRVTVPNGAEVDFRRDVFDKAVAEVIVAWQSLFADIRNKAPVKPVSYFREWNLDTGVDESKVYFW